MIIGNNNNENKFKDNNFLDNDTFNNQFNDYKENSKIQHKNIFVKDLKDQKYTNVNNQNDMYDKSLAMLNDRLKNGLISFDEFNKQVNLLAKRRNNSK
ncbi:MAG: hypothetical protein IKH54_04335 [Bacilli bacterium]|nr:hypothetical protein [Bacilli bacterium]